MAAIDFFNETQNMVNKWASFLDVTDLSRYYSLTDFAEGSPINNYTGKAQVFAQMAFHAQNATMISNIVKFTENISFLDRITDGFHPDAFYAKYIRADRNESVELIVEALRTGLIWNSDKSTKKDAIAIRYANTLLDCAEYLRKFHDREAVLLDLQAHSSPNDASTVVKYFRSNINHGFSVALTCDFLKEFDSCFSYLPKPDVHIKDALCAYYGRENGYYLTEKKEYQCIREMQQIVAEINAARPDHAPITVYQFDRMIWLACTGNFFLDDVNDNIKKTYIGKIQSIH